MACGDPPLYQRGLGRDAGEDLPVAAAGGKGFGEGGSGSGGGSSGGAGTGGVAGSGGSGGQAGAGAGNTAGEPGGGSGMAGAAPPQGGSAGKGGGAGLGGPGGVAGAGGRSGSGGAGAGGGAGGSAGGGAATVSGAIVHYAFDETTGTVIRDDAGTADNATAVDATFTAGRFGNAATFSGTSQYATLPTGLTSSLTDMTVALWVNVSTASAYQRLIDCGNTSSTGYWFISPQAGEGTDLVLRFAITLTDYRSEQQLDAVPLATGQWKHVAVVLGAQGGTLYVDGAVAASSSAVTLRPKDLGALAHGYLGRSQYTSDPYFAGRIDDLYIFDRALSAAEIATLMKGP